jgi:FkbM family methyltransferase
MNKKIIYNFLHISRISYLFSTFMDKTKRFIKVKKMNSFQKRFANTTLIKQTKINNCHLLVSSNNSIGQQILALKQYEKANTNFLKKIIKKDWVCIDIGANIGYYTCLLAKMCPLGKIYAFEPSDIDFSLLSLNIYLNNFKNVHLNNLAIGNKNGFNNFNITIDSGLSSLKDTKRGKVDKVKKVKIQTLDSYVLENQIDRVDFIKIDVEGAEMLILKGSRYCLEKLKPNIIQIEICIKNLKAYKISGFSIINLLKKHNFTPYQLVNNRLSLYKELIINKDVDLFFIRKTYKL